MPTAKENTKATTSTLSLLSFNSTIPGIEHDLTPVVQYVAVAPMQNWTASNYPIPILVENSETKLRA